MMKKSGFTLAEVLITLGIIGVVAAMTIPTLIANTNSAKFRSQFKKSISTLNQAGLMAQAQYDIDYSTPTAGCTATSDDPNSTLTFCGIFNGTLSGHTILTADPYAAAGRTAPTVTGTTAANLYYLTLADGSIVAFSKNAAACTRGVGKAVTEITGTECVGYIDVNGTTLPNKVVGCAAAGSLEQPAYATDYEGVVDGTCTVPNDANHMTDVYPIVFHDATVEPATQAARFVLTTSK